MAALYAGLDVSLELTSVCIVDEDALIGLCARTCGWDNIFHRNHSGRSCDGILRRPRRVVG
jgi:hypothetical protein